MAATSPISVDENQDPPLTVDGMALGYVGSSGHDVARFQNITAPFSVQTGGDQLTGARVDMGSLVPRLGGAFGVTDIGAVGGIRDKVMTAWQTQTKSYGKPSTPLKAPWTKVQDSILKDMVEQHGEHNWTVIAQSLPGRAGKQCRERWINHLRPDIKKNDFWTEDDDKMLIEAHIYYGNRWSVIAKHLSGRSENGIKNHWNATLRSLKAKRRQKKRKSEQTPPGRFSILENYIRSIYRLDDAVPVAPTNPEMSFNAANSVVGSSNPGMINLNMPPPSPDMNATNDPHLQKNCLNYPMYVPSLAPLLQETIDHQGPQQAYSSLNMLPYTDYFALLRSETGRFHAGASSSNPGIYGYYRDARCGSAGGSGGPAVDTDDTIELASREFLMPPKDQVTLDFTRFK
ncbi:hypothetical protein EJB05_29834, partial [Eragrostis curvula]